MKKSLKSSQKCQTSFAKVALSTKDQRKVQGGNAVNPFEWPLAKF